MRISRAILFWLVIIVGLVLLEVAQVTNLFRLGFASVLGNLIGFVFALLLVTVLALVGAVFVGIFIAHRILSPQGFSPFEEEMLKMRQEVADLHRKVELLLPEDRRSSEGPHRSPPSSFSTPSLHDEERAAHRPSSPAPPVAPASRSEKVLP